MEQSPRKPIPIYAPLFAAFPVLAVFSANLGLFPRGDLWRPLGVALVAGLLAFGLASLLFRSLHRGAWVASWIAVAVWLHGPLFSHLGGPGWFGWALAVALAVVAWRFPKAERIPTAALNRFGLALVLVSGGFIAIKTVKGTRAAGVVGIARAKSPDIFYLQVDGYGRADQLLRVMGFDNQPFLESLKQRGFFVAEKANSSYCQTVLSLGSTLNLEEIQTLVPSGVAQREDLNGLVDRPRVVRDLRRFGYESIAVTTGFPGFTFEGFDLVLQPGVKMSYFESILLDMTPIRASEALALTQYEQRQDALEFGFEALADLGKRTAKPRFIFAHILAPHPPFVFRADGSRRPREGPFGFWDGSHFLEHYGNADAYRAGYVDQVQWLNRRLLDLLDKLSKDYIVILQSDHGSKVGVDQVSMQKTDLREAFGVLAAYRFPEAMNVELPADVRPTNALRAVVSALTGEPLPPLPGRSFYSPFDRPTEFVDVTDALR